MHVPTQSGHSLTMGYKVEPRSYPRPSGLSSLQLDWVLSPASQPKIWCLEVLCTSRPAQCALWSGNCREVAVCSTGLSQPWLPASQHAHTPCEQRPSSYSPPQYVLVDPPVGKGASQVSSLPVFTFIPSQIPPRDAVPILMPFFPILPSYMGIFLAALVV